MSKLINGMKAEIVYDSLTDAVFTAVQKTRVLPPEKQFKWQSISARIAGLDEEINLGNGWIRTGDIEKSLKEVIKSDRMISIDRATGKDRTVCIPVVKYEHD